MNNTSSTRLFDLPSILAVVTDTRLARKDGGVNAVIDCIKPKVGDFESRDSLRQAAAAEILKQHPNLEKKCFPAPQRGEVKGWLKNLRNQFGEHLALSR